MKDPSHLDTIERLGKFEVKDSHSCRVLQERIFSLALHPETNVVCIGDKVGNIAIWDTDKTGSGKSLISYRYVFQILEVARALTHE